MESPQEKTLADYIDIARRRRFYFLAPAAFVLLFGTILVFLLPKVYRSDAVVLIESQQVSADLVRAAMTSFADERIEVIKQRVLTTANILEIIKKFNLYPGELNRKGPSEVVEQFRENVVIERVSVDSRRRDAVTIAFRLGFLDSSARTAQSVTSELLTLFLSENVKTRSARAAETTEFLSSEAQKIQVQITDIETALARFKQENRNSLPELGNANQAELDRLNDTYRTIGGQMESLKGRVDVLQSQVSVVSAQGSEQGGAQNVAALEADLARLLSRYTEKHPDVIALRQRIDEARQKESVSAPVLSPAVAQLQSQIDAARSEQRFLEGQRTGVEAQIKVVQERIAKAPEVEQQYKNLLRDYDNLQSKYQELKDKQIEARISQNLEEEQMGERFSVVEPPQLPAEPAAPDRGKLLLLVLAASFGAGGGLVVVLEMMDPALRGQRTVAAVLGSPPLVTVPLIETSTDYADRKRKWLLLGLAMVATLLVGLLLVHFFVIDLDLLFYTLTSKLARL
jgi:polysaccharide chain length determinant protein (PEP-CTERM system associated)